MKRYATRLLISIYAIGMGAVLMIPAYSQTPATVVHMKDLRFAPDRLSVHSGDTVVFVNDDDYAHTVTAIDKSFDSGNIAGHASWSQTFKTPGRYPYVCLYHLPNMKGELVVVPARDSAPIALPKVARTPSPSPVRSAAATTVVHLQRSAVRPRNATVRALGVVSFVNDDSVPRQIVQIGGGFSSGVIPPHGTWQHLFAQAGLYRYRCLKGPRASPAGTIRVR